MSIKEIVVPDIGDFDSVEVIEVLVQEGDVIEVEDSLITVESDKASMEIPSSEAGKVIQMKVALGDNISQGSVIMMLDVSESNAESSDKAQEPKKIEADIQEESKPEITEEPQQTSTPAQTEAKTSIQEIVVPDIGDFDEVEVIEILVNEGDEVNAEDSLITVESDKASMEIPSSSSGTVLKVKVALGDKISQDAVILMMEVKENVAPQAPEESPSKPKPSETNQSLEKMTPAVATPAKASPGKTSGDKPSPTANIDEVRFSKAYASPSVRKFARELGVDLGKVKGTSRKGRINKEDVKGFVKKSLSSKSSGSSLGISPAPEIDFSQWGDVKTEALSKINKLTGQYLHRSWVTVPHVTQFDEADITEQEAFRKQLNSEMDKDGIKITPLAFIVKAVVATLKAYPRFNSSLDHTGENLILKQYFNIGVAVDTPNGLVVPVINDADQKSLVEISKEIRELATKARAKKLKPSEMQGGCFSISSLGGIGGTKFTPIVNAPEVAVLGVSRSKTEPLWDGSEFKPRLMLPLSLSYDHRVIDGADGARFTTHLSKMLSDIRRMMV